MPNWYEINRLALSHPASTCSSFRAQSSSTLQVDPPSLQQVDLSTPAMAPKVKGTDSSKGPQQTGTKRVRLDDLSITSDSRLDYLFFACSFWPNQLRLLSSDEDSGHRELEESRIVELLPELRCRWGRNLLRGPSIIIKSNCRTPPGALLSMGQKPLERTLHHYGSSRLERPVHPGRREACRGGIASTQRGPFHVVADPAVTALNQTCFARSTTKPSTRARTSRRSSSTFLRRWSTSSATGWSSRFSNGKTTTRRGGPRFPYGLSGVVRGVDVCPARLRC